MRSDGGKNTAFWKLRALLFTSPVNAKDAMLYKAIGLAIRSYL
jgi:hypothetical protein